MLRVLPHEREAEGIEVVIGDLPEQLLGPRGVTGALCGDCKLILDVRVQQIALPQVCGRFSVLPLIERDESHQLVHRLELARVRVGCEQLGNAIGLLLGRRIVPAPRRGPPFEVCDLRLLPPLECGVPRFVRLLHQ